MRKFKILSNGYTVTTKQNLLTDLFENQLNILNGKNTYRINWFNFNAGSIFFDYNGNPYSVKNIDHENKTVNF